MSQFTKVGGLTAKVYRTEYCATSILEPCLISKEFWACVSGASYKSPTLRHRLTTTQNNPMSSTPRRQFYWRARCVIWSDSIGISVPEQQGHRHALAQRLSSCPCWKIPMRLSALMARCSQLFSLI